MTITIQDRTAPRTDDAFARLVDRDLDRVWRFLRSLVRDPDLARDLCHDTFLRLRRALAEGRVRRLEDGLPNAGYVFAAARRAAYDHGRRRRDVVPLDAAADARADGTPHGDLERGQLGHALDAALNALDDDHRAVFVLSELEGLRYEEIAEALGLPAGTVASRKHAAVHHLRRTLEGMGHAL